MDDVTNPAAVTGTPVETVTTTPPATGETKTGDLSEPQGGTTPQATQESGMSNSELENLKKALKAEREQKKEAHRRLAELEGRSKAAEYDPEDLEKVMSHPAFQEVLMKNATYELKEGTKEVLERYPQVPKQIANAILKNPRGYVSPETRDVPTALLDIEDYIAEIAEQYPTETPQPKTVTVANTNAGGNSNNQVEVQIQEILKKPVDAWTPDEVKLISQQQAKS